VRAADHIAEWFDASGAFFEEMDTAATQSFR
jgi:hypothetical protein